MCVRKPDHCIHAFSFFTLSQGASKKLSASASWMLAASRCLLRSLCIFLREGEFSVHILSSSTYLIVLSLINSDYLCEPLLTLSQCTNSTPSILPEKPHQRHINCTVWWHSTEKVWKSSFVGQWRCGYCKWQLRNAEIVALVVKTNKTLSWPIQMSWKWQ